MGTHNICFMEKYGKLSLNHDQIPPYLFRCDSMDEKSKDLNLLNWLNIVDSDQTAPQGSRLSLIRVYTVWPDLSVQKNTNKVNYINS